MSKVDDIMALIKECKKDEGFTAFGFLTQTIEHIPNVNTNLRGFTIGTALELAEALAKLMEINKDIEKIIILAVAMNSKSIFNNDILNQKPNEN